MNNKNIVDYLDHYIKSENANFAVLLKGGWGTGKTFFIKKLIENWSQPGKPKDHFISVNPIYISLNGTTSKKEIIEMLKEKITPFIYSKGVKITREIFRGFAKSTLKIDFDLLDDKDKDGSFNLSFDPVSIFKSDNDTIKGNRIIIFDDIERSKIPVDEIYGFINDFVEHSKCKIILISDEDRIIKKDEDDNENENSKSKYPYLTFKEKIIGQTFEIVPDVDQAVEHFLNSGVFEIKKYLADHKKLIIKIFNSSEKNRNLRVLQRAIFDFDRLFKNTEKELENDPVKYTQLIKNFLAYFLIYYIEYNTGNKTIVNFQSPSKIEDQKHTYNHYDELISSEYLFHSTKLFTTTKLMDYITTGNFKELVPEINNSLIYNPLQEKDWEKLWYWRFLEDRDFTEIINKVEKDFFNLEDLNFTEVLHIAGLFFELIDNKLYFNKTKIQVSNRAKLLLSKSKDLEQITDSSLALRSSWRKSYISINTPEFQDLLTHLKKNAAKKLKIKSQKFINSILFGLRNDNVDNLYETFRQYDDALNSSYEKTSFLKNVKVKEFAEIVFNLNNAAVTDLDQYFNYRYYPEQTYTNLKIENFHKQEIKFVEGLKKELEKKSKQISDKPIKLLAIENFIKSLEKIIIRLQ